MNVMVSRGSHFKSHAYFKFLYHPISLDVSNLLILMAQNIPIPLYLAVQL